MNFEPMRLWHFTKPENASSILEGGFLDNKFGYVNFTAAGDTTYEGWGPALIEVTLNVSDEELERVGYRLESIDTYEKQAGPLVKIEDPARYRRSVFYQIPAAYVNAHTVSIELVDRGRE
jgi:hypothetical protein